jgi:hypothetical protein
VIEMGLRERVLGLPEKTQKYEYDSGNVVNSYDNGSLWDAPVKNNGNESGNSSLDYLRRKVMPDQYEFTPDSNYYLHKDINEATNSLQQGNVSVPAPDVAQPKGKAWWEYILDPLNALQYGAARGVRNLVDDDPNTKFFKGVGEGVSAGFSNDTTNRTSWKSVLEALIRSDNDTKRNIGVDLTTFTNNALNTVLHPGDSSKQVSQYEADLVKSSGNKDIVNDFANNRTYSGGFAGDIVLDPLNFINGIGKAAKVVGKGSDALKAADAGIDAEHALEAMRLANRGDNAAEAAYYTDKAAKALGYVPDSYKGITLGTANHNIKLVSPETLGKVGDVLNSTKLNPFGLVNKASDAIGNSTVARKLKDLFSTTDMDTIDFARKHPEEALKVIVSNTNKNSLFYKWHNTAMYNTLQDTIKGQNDVGVKGANDITEALEAGDKVERWYTNVKKEVPNSKYVEQLNYKKNYYKNTLDNLKNQRDTLVKELDEGDTVTRAQRLGELKNLTDQLEAYNAVPTIYSANYLHQLENAGVDLDRYFDVNNDMAKVIVDDTAYTAGHSIEDIESYLRSGMGTGAVKQMSDEELRTLAVQLKKASENTMYSMRNIYGGLVDDYVGSGTATIDDIMSEGGAKAFTINDDDVVKIANANKNFKGTLENGGAVNPDTNLTREQIIEKYKLSDEKYGDEFEEFRKNKGTYTEPISSEQMENHLNKVEANKPKIESDQTLINEKLKEMENPTPKTKLEAPKVIDKNNPSGSVKFMDIEGNMTLNDYIQKLSDKLDNMESSSETYSGIKRIIGGDVRKTYDFPNMTRAQKDTVMKQLENKIRYFDSHKEPISAQQVKYLTSLKNQIDRVKNITDDQISSLTKGEASELISMLKSERDGAPVKLKPEELDNEMNNISEELTENRKEKYGLEAKGYDDTGIKKNSTYDDETPKKLQERIRSVLYKDYLEDGNVNFKNLDEFTDKEIQDFLINRQNALGEYAPEAGDLSSLSRTELNKLVKDYADDMMLNSENPKVAERVKSVRKNLETPLDKERITKLNAAKENLKKLSPEMYDKYKDIIPNNVHNYNKLMMEFYNEDSGIIRKLQQENYDKLAKTPVTAEQLEKLNKVVYVASKQDPLRGLAIEDYISKHPVKTYGEYRDMLNKIMPDKSKGNTSHDLLNEASNFSKSTKTTDENGLTTLVKGDDKLVMPDTNASFHKFSTEQGVFKVDTGADIEYVNRVRNIIKQLPEELQDIVKTQEISIIKGVRSRGTGTALGTHIKNDITLWDNKLSRKFSDEQIKNVIEHEIGHSLSATDTNARRYVLKKLSNEITSLPDESKNELAKLLKSSSNVHMSGKELEDIKNIINDGFISEYPRAMKGTESVRTVNNEHFAELTSLMFDNADLSKSIKELLPKTTDSFYSMLKNTPTEYFEKAIPVTVKSGSEELLRKIEATKQMLDTFADDTIAKNLTLQDVNKNISKIEKILDSDDSFEKFFDKEFKDKLPLDSRNKTKIVTERVAHEKVIKWYDTLPEQYREFAKKIEKDFNDWAEQEGIEKVDNYILHGLNSELKNNKKAQKLFQSTNDMSQPNIINSLHRKYDKTIKEMNAYMKDKHGIDNFFETMATRLYLERGINHNKFMFQKEYLDQTVRMFGERIDKEALKALDPKAKKAFYEQVHEKIQSGDYVIVEVDPKYSEVVKKTISDDEISKGYTRRNNTRETARLNESDNPITQQLNNTQINNPFIQVDPREITAEKLMQRNSNPVYIMPRAMRDSYLKTAKKQFDTEKNMFLDMYDKFTKLWKSKAIMSVGYHAQNILGNVFNSYLGIGGSILDPILNKVAIDIKLGRGSFNGISGKEWQKILRDNGISGDNSFDDVVNDFRSGVSDSFETNPLKKAIKKVNPFSSDNVLFSANRSVGSAIEDQAKIVNFLKHVKDGKSYVEARELVNKFLFDYSDITDFEQKFMKRIVPFYTWLRKNVPLQFENIAKQPAKYGKVLRGLNYLTTPETDEEKAYRPDYLDDAMHIGEGKYLNVNLPYKDLGRLNVKDTISSLNPLLKMLIEVPANKNTYFDSPIKNNEGELVTPTKYQELIPGLTKETPNGKMIDPYRKYILDLLNPELKRFSNIAGSTDAEDVVGRVSGVKTYNVDYDKAKKNAMYDYIEKLKAAQKNAKKQGYMK